MRRRTLLRSAAGAASMGVVGSVGASRSRGEQETTTDGETGTATETGFSLRSPAFENGGSIPPAFTCDGENRSPPLRIESVPDGAESLALVVDDPDAPDPPFVHWLLWDVPADAGRIPAEVPAGETVDALDGARQGANGTGEFGYVGPCPPREDPRHTYLFTLYALEEPLGLDPGAGYEEVLAAAVPRAISRTRYVGQYERAEGGAGGETTADDGSGDATESAGDVVEVAVGPEGDYLKFVPDQVEISVGDTVRWTAESEGHNVSAKPEADPKVSIPADADPFASYEASRSFMVMQVGETYEHTFTVPGTYTYVCVPHADQGMVGEVVVE
ncbi:YbhB/YbcL family Raf kinase inhibitor-like protein [Halorussus marinus]|uniref:YbhB/YbcL family Raf kinase inhibitor-like protein n=1 Tax=Halorussus marinus TaxID=2505976 RepID=UPI001ADC7CE7|nr:YbhB/YbcL family Raf kinase inhibitor-like protein [Halorussus marinus]